jgi:hypothetical protein
MFMYSSAYVCHILCILHHCVLFCIVCVLMCTVLLPLGVHLIVVNKNIIMQIILWTSLSEYISGHWIFNSI